MVEDLDFGIIERFYHISPRGAANPMIELPASLLLDQDKVREVLEKGAALVKATSLELPASFIGSTFFYLCATYIVFMAQENRIPDLTLDNLTFQIEGHNDHFHLGYKINRLEWKDVPDTGREAFVAKEFSRLIQDTVYPGVEAVAASAGVKSAMIWNQFAGQYTFLTKYLKANETREEVLVRLEQDCAVILEQISADEFGRRRHPFVHKPRYIDSPYSPGEQIAIRSSCCMYYCKEDGVKCYSCPKLTAEAREEMRQEILAKAR
ncbi:hypothetical protein [Paenibacillus pinihumi]|uniref:hypothetical protein n=1 Tax=Paenibacillus pinihumi TaxID=669462 RepID=UPI0004095ABF|nr:hypothetical protein [Paenibacillus pinihumi]